MGSDSEMGQGTAASSALEDTSVLPQGADCAYTVHEQLFPQTETQGSLVDILLHLLAVIVWASPASIRLRRGYPGLRLSSAYSVH